MLEEQNIWYLGLVQMVESSLEEIASPRPLFAAERRRRTPRSAADRTGRTWGSGRVIRSRAATTQGWFAAAPLVCVVAMRFEIVEGVRACNHIIVIWRGWFPKLGCNRTGLNPIEMCYQKIMTWLIPIEMLLTAGLNGNEGLKTIGGIEQNGELDLFAGHQNSSHPAPMSVSSPRSKLFWFSF